MVSNQGMVSDRVKELQDEMEKLSVENKALKRAADDAQNKVFLVCPSHSVCTRDFCAGFSSSFLFFWYPALSLVLGWRYVDGILAWYR